MHLPSTKTLIIILISTLTLTFTLSILANLFQEALLVNSSLAERQKQSLIIALILFYVLSFSVITLFIRHFPKKVLKILNQQNPTSLSIKQQQHLKKLNTILQPNIMERVALIFNVLMLIMFFIWTQEILEGLK
ncbi:MAG: Unknown protein [uncultured Sulfurovum sp.]|uniref:Uncharacterized protein n=1 Tax=uncultured Sulfurovum sp. TaxID=269237 RepID=A0A6S6SP38_9BACT|nr:MAG: Unknown protein [uncultured Sulfurovum sp.]